MKSLQVITTVLCQIEEQPMRGEMGAKRSLYRDGGKTGALMNYFVIVK